MCPSFYFLPHDNIETKPDKPRRQKGSILHKFPANFTLLDLETTGFDPNKDKIIEMGALKIRDYRVVDTFSHLTNPGIPIPDHIQHLTGITQEEVSGLPSALSRIVDFVEFIGDDIIVGHNIGFDVNFIYEAYLEVSGKYFRNNWVDTLSFSRQLLPDLPCHKLSALCKHFDIGYPNAHRATADCIVTLEVYIRLSHLFSNMTSSKKPPSANPKEISPAVSDHVCADINNPFYNKTCVFTGTLAYFSRNSAKFIVEQRGGRCTNSVSGNTDYLIVGNASYSPYSKDGKTSKHKTAEELIKKGSDIEILSEDVFYDMIEGN